MEGDLPILIETRKNTCAIRAHGYHTKVPPSAITPFIEAFTEPGDIVLDSFCGSGMTGLAARQTGRNALLSDFSPAAVHIARNYNTPCDPAALAHAVARVRSIVEPTMTQLYNPSGHASSIVEYTTWSDVFRCGTCGSDIVYNDVHATIAVDGFACPRCCARARKGDLTWIGEVPVMTHVSSGDSRGITAHTPTEAEKSLIARSNVSDIPFWTPTLDFGQDREMWRASHAAMGIRSAADFYTRRNLHALAALHDAIANESNPRLKQALMFAFTGSVNRASRRYQWNAKRPTNVMTGTLYVSSLRYEWNVWSLFRRKAADVVRLYQQQPAGPSTVEVRKADATALAHVKDGSVDMVFVDPPFGSNIFYADSSLLWDAWLGQETDRRAEIVVNQRRRGEGAKDLAAYARLLTSAFAETTRSLRPGGRAVLAFSNADDRVWTALLDAVSDAGLDVRTVHVLDKGQPSIKGVQGHLGKQNVTRLDLALTLERKSKGSPTKRMPASASFLSQAATRAVVAGHDRTDQIYSAVLRDAIAGGYGVAGITMPMIVRMRSTERKERAKAGKDAHFSSGEHPLDKRRPATTP